MIKFIPLFIRVKLREIDWLLHLYQKYILKLPLHFNRQEKNYFEHIANNNQILALFPTVESGPKISIITPIYKPDIQHFKAMLGSVINQRYENWELILLDDCSDSRELDRVLAEYTKHPNITVAQRKSNGHISAASNDALELATGDYIALLDHDDLLHLDALNTVALHILTQADANILYSDEDKVNEQGGFEQAHYKPKWSPDLLYSHNYICHLGVYKKSLLDEIGGFRLGVEGSQDYDLLLRAVKACDEQGIVHIPHVLYHWRIAQGSTALAGAEKSYTDEAGLKALRDYFKGDEGITVENGLLSNTYKVNWPLPKDLPLVSILIPTKNAKALVEQCINSIYKLTTYANFEILLVDNQSDDEEALTYFQKLNKENKVRLLAYDKPFNYSALNNFAVAQAKGAIIVLMNNDIEIISENWLSEMVSQVSRQAIGCVGAKLYYPNHTIQHAGVITGIGGVAGHSHKYFPKEHPGYFKRLNIVQNISAVTGACLAVTKEIFQQAGGLNEGDLTIAFNDVDFCLKVQALGYKNIWTPYAEMIHHESVSRGAENTPEKVARFNKEADYMKWRWGEALSQDPYYSPWLSLKKEDFSLR